MARRSTASWPARSWSSWSPTYLEAQLPAPDRARFDEHLATCPGCAEYLEQVRAVARLAGRLTEESIAPGAREALLAAFRRWKRGTKG